jgi:hypothetical protein
MRLVTERLSRGDAEPNRYRYELMLRLPDGTEKDAGSFTTTRSLRAGDLVNLPNDADGRPETSDLHKWRVFAVDDKSTLVLGYESRWSTPGS